MSERAKAKFVTLLHGAVFFQQMNKKRIVLIILLFLLPLAGFALWHNRPVPAELRLRLNGTAGLPVAGTVVVDGASQEFSGTLPTNIIVRARCLDFTVHLAKPNGTLNCQLLIADAPPLNTSTTGRLSDIQGHYSHRWGGKTVRLTTLGRAN